ncbi:PaaI family thioesterase [Phenylobacterium sp.]|uniref:PaaI family thioesterase n=1 Tax=Phenylobacterium sp. TaxID=1871053 RepID=UPI002898E5A9|nr:PaaI family thioesterase [Phenylobacterium sp.]
MTFWTDQLDLITARKNNPPPVVNTLKLGLCEEWGPGWVRKRWEPDPSILNSDGSLFGGYLAALGDQILSFTAMTVMPDGASYRTVNLQMQFVKVGRAHPLLIEGRVTAASKRLVTVEADFRREDGELIARVNGQQIVLPVEHG